MDLPVDLGHLPVITKELPIDFRQLSVHLSLLSINLWLLTVPIYPIRNENRHVPQLYIQFLESITGPADGPRAVFFN